MRADLDALASAMAAPDISIASQITTSPLAPLDEGRERLGPQNPLGHDAPYAEPDDSIVQVAVNGLGTN